MTNKLTINYENPALVQFRLKKWSFSFFLKLVVVTLPRKVKGISFFFRFYTGFVHSAEYYSLVNCFKRLYAFNWNGFVCPLYYLEWWVLYCGCVGRLSLCLRLVSVWRQRSHLVPENGVRLPYSLGTSVNTSIFFKHLRQNWGGYPWVVLRFQVWTVP